MASAPDAERRTRPSFCRICNAGCGILVTTRGEQIEQIRGDPEHPTSRGYTCPKGRALPAFHHDARRLDHPLVRERGSFRRVGWEHALGDLSDRLRKILDEDGPDAVAGYLGTAIAFDSAGYHSANAFLAAIGTLQRYTCATLDTPCKPLVSELMSGFPGLHPIPDPDSTTLLLLVGTNPVVSHGHLTGFASPAARLRAIARRGEVWVVDPRHTETARHASRHLPVRPGTDAWVLAALVREILRDGADRRFLEAHADGLEALAGAVEPFDLATSARRCGVPLQDLEALLEAIRQHGRLVAVSGTGSTMSATANVNEWLLWALQIITGSFERPGGAWFNPGFVASLNRIPRWSAGSGEALAGPPSRPELPRRINEYPCAGLVDEIEAGRIRALFVPGGNPIAAFPEVPRLRAALATLDVLVVGDVVRNEIVDLATHVWPCAGQLERRDVVGVMEFYKQEVMGQLTAAIVPPVAERRPLWWCFGQLAARLELTCLPGNLDVDECSEDEVVSLLARDRVAALREAPHGAVTTRPDPWVTDRLLPDGRWRLAPAPLLAALSDLREPAPLALIPGRQLRTMNSALRDVAARRERLDSVEIHVAASDASRCGVQGGSRIRVRSAHGQVIGTAVIDPDLRQGAVWIPHGWLTPNVGMLTSAHEDIDPLTGMVLQSGVGVVIESV